MQMLALLLVHSAPVAATLLEQLHSLSAQSNVPEDQCTEKKGLLHNSQYHTGHYHV
jgi:hypothetical protein